MTERTSNMRTPDGARDEIVVWLRREAELHKQAASAASSRNGAAHHRAEAYAYERAADIWEEVKYST